MCLKWPLRYYRLQIKNAKSGYGQDKGMINRPFDFEVMR